MPRSIFIRELKLLSILVILTEKIITGILNKSTIMLAKEKFVLFNKFIDAEIEPKQDKINDPMINVITKLYISFKGRLKNIPAIGIETKKGICTNIKCETIFKKTINS